MAYFLILSFLVVKNGEQDEEANENYIWNGIYHLHEDY